MIVVTIVKANCILVFCQVCNFVICSCAAFVKAMIDMLSMGPTHWMSFLWTKCLALTVASMRLVLLQTLIYRTSILSF